MAVTVNGTSKSVFCTFGCGSSFLGFLSMGRMVPAAAIILLVWLALDVRDKLVALATEHQAVRERLYYVENLLQLWGRTLEQRVVAVEQELAASFVDED